MVIRMLSDADSVAREAAAFIAGEARVAVAARGRFIFAVSGGRTPWVMLRALAGEKVPWEGVHIVQVDERVAPAGGQDRNLTHLRESLLDRTPLRPEQLYAMPVELPDLEAAATQYALISAAASVLGRVLTGTTAGALIEALGYPGFYLLTTVLALPGILLFWFMMRRGMIDRALGTAGRRD